MQPFPTLLSQLHSLPNLHLLRSLQHGKDPFGGNISSYLSISLLGLDYWPRIQVDDLEGQRGQETYLVVWNQRTRHTFVAEVYVTSVEV